MVGAERRRRGIVLKHAMVELGYSLGRGPNDDFPLMKIAMANRSIQDGIPTEIAYILLRGLRKPMKPGIVETFIGFDKPKNGGKPRPKTTHTTDPRYKFLERQGLLNTGRFRWGKTAVYRYFTTMDGVQLLLTWAYRSPDFKNYLDAYMPKDVLHLHKKCSDEPLTSTDVSF